MNETIQADKGNASETLAYPEATVRSQQMAHTYTKLRETKRYGILHGLHSDIQHILLSDYMNGHIEGITIKDGGYPNEEVMVRMNDGDKFSIVLKDGRWQKKDLA